MLKAADWPIMATLAELLLEHGIRARDYRDGGQKLPCPACSRDRKKPNDPCLSLTINGDCAVWNCHHCGWSGAVNERVNDRQPRHRQRPTPIKPTSAPTDPSPAVLRWLENRGIKEATARRNRIGSARVYVPALGREADCIAFPYFRNGELINVKFRALDEKAFAQVKGAEKILYGLDDIADSKTAIIVEGELDKLALEEAGFRNVVSVPDGAPAKVKVGDPDPDDAKFSYLANCGDYLDRLDRVILAVDDDAPGRALAEELARRLGKERCWRMSWPDSGDAPCKDANETLLRHGPEVLRECIDLAEPYPITGLHNAGDGLEALSGSRLQRDPPRREWLVEGCFLKGTVALIAGDGGIGKSLLCQQLATSAVLGKPWLGLSLTAGRALHLACEDDGDELHRRQYAINGALGVSMEDVIEAGINLIPRVAQDNALMAFDRAKWRMVRTSLMDRLVARCRSEGIQYVVIDTATQTFRGNQNDEIQVADYITELRRLAILIQGVVVITKHPSMAGRALGTGESGNVAWHNSVRSRLYLYEDKGLGLVLSGMKNNYGRKLEPVPLKWEHGCFVRVDVAAMGRNYAGGYD